MLLESRLRLLGIHRECVFFLLLLMLFSPLLLTLVAFKQKVVVFAIGQLEELAVLPTSVLFLSPNRAHYLSLTLKKHGAEPIDHNQKW